MEKKFCNYAQKPCRTQEQAELRAAYRSIPRQPIRAYKCESCGYWHLTSRPKREDVILREPEERDTD